MKRLAIGIDTGTVTGLAVWDIQEQKFNYVRQLKIHKAIFYIQELIETHGKDSLVIFVEDARKRKFFKGVNTAARLQGAGSIKRDASVWDDYLKDTGVEYYMKAPGNTKVTPEYFEKLTGIKTLKGEHHLRDAAMMVINYRPQKTFTKK